MDVEQTVLSALSLLDAAETQVGAAKFALHKIHKEIVDVMQARERLNDDRRRFEEERKLFQQVRARTNQINVTTDNEIRLVVGGQRYVVSKETLCRVEGSFLAACFNGEHPMKADEDGVIHLDRDPRWFDYVILFLRNQFQLPIISDPEVLQKVQQEFSFFGIPWHDIESESLVDIYKEGWSEIILRGHTAQVSCISANDTFIVTGGEDATVRVWELSTGTPVFDFTSSHSDVGAVSVHDCMVASGNIDGTVSVWHLKTKSCSRTWKELSPVDFIKIMGAYLVIGLSERQGGRFGESTTCIKAYAMPTIDLLWDKENVNSLSSYGTLGGCILGAVGKTIYMWSLDDGQVVSEFTGHRMEVVGITNVKGGFVSMGMAEDDCEYEHKVDLTPSDDSELLLWDNGGQVLTRLNLLDSFALARFAAGLSSIVLIENSTGVDEEEGDPTLVIRGFYSDDVVRIRGGHKEGISDVVVIGQKIISTGDDWSVRIWQPYNTPSGSVYKRIKKE